MGQGTAFPQRPVSRKKGAGERACRARQGGALIQRHMKMQKFGPLGYPEHQHAHDEYGVFPEASGAAYFQGKAFFAEGQQGNAVRGAHVEEHMGERAEAEAPHQGVGQGTELSGVRPCPQRQP